MKLGLVIASLFIATITGCAASAEEPREEQSEQTPPIEEQKKDEQAAPASSTQVTPTMMCKIWEYVDGRKVCRW